MPNYSLVVNSKFNPRTLQEMLVPFEKYGAAYKEQEDALAQLAAGASVWGGLEDSGGDSEPKVWKGMVDNGKDPIAAAQLAKYVTDLEAQRNAIATNGLDVNSRRKMLDLKARYAKEVGSIENAYKAREEMWKAQQAAYIQSGGNVRYSQWASQDSLDKYLNGNRPEYLMLNLDNVLKESAAGAKAMSERYFSTKEGRAFGDQYLKLIETQGISPGDALKILRSETSAYPEFQKFVSDLETKYNIGQFSDIDQAAFNAAVTQGINSGITYKKDNKLTQNGEYLSAAERFNQKMQERHYELSEQDLELRKQELEQNKLDSGLSLPDGRVVVKKDGAWVATDPENPTAQPEVLSTAQLQQLTRNHQKPEGFKPLNFEFGIFGNGITFFDESRIPIIHNTHFNEKDAKKIDLDDLNLSANAKLKLVNKLKDYNLEIDDVDIYEDYDFASRNAYRIVYKGDDVKGNTPSSSGGATSGSGQTQSGRYNGDFQ